MYKFMPGIVLVTIALLAQICTAGLGSVHDVAPIAFKDEDGIKLDFGFGQIYDKTAYNKAIVFMEELKTSSSCHRLAASTMVQVCQILDETTPLDVSLAEVKEEYAAKMAACELSSVYNKSKDTVPKACKAFLPSKEACPKSRSDNGKSKMCYAHVSRAQIASCISALEGRPQSWTSYSNALQNVHHVCQASRLAIDKDIMLTQLKTAVDLFNAASEEAKVNSELYQAEAKHNLARFEAAHVDFLVAIKTDWSNMSDELVKYTWKSFLNMFDGMSTHYGNLTDYFTRSSDAAIAKQDLALNKADDVKNALEDHIAMAKHIAVQQAHAYEVMNANNAKILSDQALLQTRQEYLIKVTDDLAITVLVLDRQLLHLKNETADVREVVQETSSLARETRSILAPLFSLLTRYAHITLNTAHALMSLNMLTLACVVMNLAVFKFVAVQLWRKGGMSVGGMIKVAVILHLTLYACHFSSMKHDRTIGSFILFTLSSRIAGLLVYILYIAGAFTHNYLELFSAAIARFPHRRHSNNVTQARPIEVTNGLHRGRGRARSEEPREMPVWE